MPVNDIEDGKQLDEGAFGSIEKARFRGREVAVKYVKPSENKVRAVAPAQFGLSLARGMRVYS